MAAMSAEQKPPPAVYRKFSGARRMALVEEYLRYAEQCVALAAKSSNAADKVRLLQMAQAWRELSAKPENGKDKDPAG
jgi:hypothetical protein